MNLRTVQGFTLGCCGLLGSGNIAEYELGQLVSLSFLPDPKNISDTHIDLAAGIVREIGVNDPLVQSQLPSIRGHFQHIIFLR